MLRITNSNRDGLVRFALESANQSFVFDEDDNEAGSCVGVTKDGYLIVEWSASPNGVEIIPPDNYATILLNDEEWNQRLDGLFLGEVELVENPFGAWLAGKATGIIKRRRATKAFKKRLKAESYLDEAKNAEAAAVAAVKKKSSRQPAEKKNFYVNFYAEGEFHQTTITAANKTEAVKIAKKGQEDFHLDSIEPAD